MEKGIKPDIIQVSTQEEIDAQVARGFPVLVGHFQKRSLKEYKNYQKAAKSFSGYITLGVIGDADVEVPMNSIYIYSNGVKKEYNESMCDVAG